MGFCFIPSQRFITLCIKETRHRGVNEEYYFNKKLITKKDNLEDHDFVVVGFNSFLWCHLWVN